MTGTAAPRVTVLMPVFNRERFVDEAIRSVLEQDFADFELLIVDDGSTDQTPKLLRAWAERDRRIVVVTAPENQGIPSALNLGLHHARARYVARLDSDDVMMPHRLARQAELLDKHPEVILASCAYETMDVDGHYIDTWRGDEPHEVVTFFLNFYNIVGGGGQVMFRLADILSEGGYAAEYPSSEDYDLWVRLLRRGRILSLPLVGMKQRQHNNRSYAQYASIKRHNWSAIMGDSLRRYLGRPIAASEIDALITLWRHDQKRGMGATADRIMREAFTIFCREHPDKSLQKCVRRRTARQWLEAAKNFDDAGDRMESLRYTLRAARWNPAIILDRFRRIR